MPTAVFAQSAPKADPPPTASISGRVTLDGQPAAGAKVVVMRDSFEQPVGKATTDAGGRFRIGGLPGGSFNLRVGYGAAVNESETEPDGKTVTLDPGEALDDIEFKLRPGGVITGRVTDAENRPVVGQSLTILKIQKNSKTGEERPIPVYFGFSSDFETDDRGVYRVYGLPPGRYVVGVGDVSVNGQTRFSMGGGEVVPGTFHPKGTDWKQAAIIDIAAGTVEEKRDIAVGGKENLFTIAGRLVDDESGAPVAKMAVGLNIRVGQGTMSSFNGMSDAKGEFRLTGIKPGQYQIIAQSWDKENDYFVDPLPVEVGNQDLKDVTVRLKRGITISGHIELTGGAKPEAVPFTEYYISVRPKPAPGERGNGRNIRVEPDGTFRLPGIRPGNYRMSFFRIGAGGYGRQDLFVVGIRRAGTELATTGFDVGNEPIDGVQVLARVASGKLRGEIRFVGGEAPKPGQYGVSLKLTAPLIEAGGYGDVDERGRFLSDDLLPGIYTVKVLRQNPNARPTEIKTFTPQTVTIPETGEATVTLTVDLSTPNEPKPQ